MMTVLISIATIISILSGPKCKFKIYLDPGCPTFLVVYPTSLWDITPKRKDIHSPGRVSDNQAFRMIHCSTHGAWAKAGCPSFTGFCFEFWVYLKLQGEYGLAKKDSITCIKNYQRSENKIDLIFLGMVPTP